MLDTAGNEIPTIISNPFCRCGLTGGCSLCNPTFYGSKNIIIERLQDANYGKAEKDNWINDKAKDAPSVEKLKEIREKEGKAWEALKKEEMLACPKCGTVLGNKDDY